MLCLKVGVERHLRIDRDGLAARQLHDHVWPHGTGRGRNVLLHLEVDVLEHAGSLDDALELGLAPNAAGVVRAQR